MTTPRDPNELIRAYLDEGPLDLREQVYDEVRAEVDHTNQRTFFGPWRHLSVMSMNQFAGFAAATLVIAVAVVAGLTLSGGGPLIGGAPSASPSASSSAEPSVRPSDDGSIHELKLACDTDPPFFLNGYGADHVPPEMLAALSLQELTLSEGSDADGPYERIAFEYGFGFPRVDARIVEPPFTRDPSGQEMSVSGDTVWQITLTGSSKFEVPSGDQSYVGPTDFRPGFQRISQLIEAGDFESVHTWYLGLHGQGECLRAFTSETDGRVVIDVIDSPTPPAGTPGYLPPFTCGGQDITVDATNTDFAPLLLTDVRVAGHDAEGYDRVVFQYSTNSTPELRVMLPSTLPPFVHDPSGARLEVIGDPIYLLNINGATKYDQSTGEFTYTGPTDFHPGLTQIVQLIEAGDFEATNNWYLGLGLGDDCLRAFELTDPGRLVIDVQH